MNKETNQIKINVGTTVTIFFEQGGNITATGFIMNERGMYVQNITYQEGTAQVKFAGKITDKKLLFLPWHTIEFCLFDVEPQEQPATG